MSRSIKFFANIVDIVNAGRMLSDVDGDVFGSVTKLGRAAADAVWRALGGEPWDPFYASRCVDTLIDAADGLPSLVTVIRELAALRDSPLLAGVETEGALGRIRDATLASDCTDLDLILRSNVERSVLRGELRLERILDRFCRQLLDRAVLDGRGGFMEQYGTAHLKEARAVLLPVASAAAAALEARPTAKRLGLARSHADVTAETDLLGGK
jgi:hypothetical protein